MMGGQTVDDKELVKIEAMVLSMTPKERKDLISSTRKNRAENESPRALGEASKS